MINSLGFFIAPQAHIRHSSWKTITHCLPHKSSLPWKAPPNFTTCFCYHLLHASNYLSSMPCRNSMQIRCHSIHVYLVSTLVHHSSLHQRGESLRCHLHIIRMINSDVEHSHSTVLDISKRLFPFKDEIVWITLEIKQIGH